MLSLSRESTCESRTSLPGALEQESVSGQIKGSWGLTEIFPSKGPFQVFQKS